MRRSRLPRFRLRQPAPLALALALAIAAIPAGANPTGPTVVNGTVTVNPAGNLLSITNSPNSIINWQSFSIGANEITRFTQQSAASAVLNRVVGAGGSIDPSVILGALQSNGRVFLINPSGIVFGAGSQIDVAGLVASSLNLSDADFLGGRLRFTQVPGAGSVVNQGAINAATGGQVYLVGPSVTNGGVITSPQGEVVLAAGNSVELVDPGTPNLRVEISASDNEAKNLGSIVADAGRIGIYAGLINHSGTIRADSVVTTEDGRIVLKATRDINLGAGSVTTANGPAGTGGTVSVTANSIATSGTLSAAGDVTLTADAIAIAGGSVAAGSVISVAPRSFVTLWLGGSGGADGLELSGAELDRFVVPNGVLRLGDLATTKGVRIQGPISFDSARVKTLTLAGGDGGAYGGMYQEANATITVQNLNLQSSAGVFLWENNVVSTLAGKAWDITFTNAGPLTVGPMVDGIAGLQGYGVRLRSDNLRLTGPGTLNGNIVDGNTSLMPRIPGTAMYIGSQPDGAYWVDGLDRIVSEWLYLGNNTVPSITVSAPVQRLGALTLYTSRTGQIDLNGSLWVNHGKNGLEIETGTLNVLQPIFANHFKVTALEVNIEAPIDSPGWGIFQTYAINIAAPVTIAGQTVQPVQEPAEKRSAVTGKVMERAATTLISESDRALLPVYTFFPEMRRGPRRPDEQ